MIKTALLLLWIIAIVATFLGFVIFLFTALFPKVEPVKKKVIKFFPMNSISTKVQDANTSSEEIGKIIQSLAKHHPLPEKVNNKPPKQVKKTLDMIFTLSGHRNMNDEMRQEMFDGLIEANPDYAQEFTNAKR